MIATRPTPSGPGPLIEFAERFLRGRLQLLPTPPEGFDALKASDRELEFYGLPPRPRASSRTEARDAWTSMFTPTTQAPLTYRPSLYPALTQAWIDNGYRLGGGKNRKSNTSATRIGTSRNWSGAIIAGSGEHFNQVYGTWFVRGANVPAGGGDDDYRCSVWIGLDGHRRHSFSMPQLGTTQIAVVVNGLVTRRYEAWWQWWLRGLPIPPFPFNPPLVVDAGDQVAASLTVVAPDTVRFTIVNKQSGEVRTLQQSAPTLAPTIPVYWRVRGAAAEWIAERPMRLNAPSLHPFADCGEINFSGCVANTPLSGPKTLLAERLVRMVAHSAPPTNMRRIAEPVRNATSDTKFSVRCWP